MPSSSKADPKLRPKPATPILLSRQGAVATCTLNAPERINALNSALMAEMTAALRTLADDREVAALVLTGAGRGFCAGADIEEFGALLDKPAQLRSFNQSLNSLVEQLASLPIPTVAAINGTCFGGGVSLALACDLRLSVATATFALTPGRLGLMYGLGDSRRLLRAVGHTRASDFLLTGRRFSAEEALAAGVLHQLAADTEALAATAGELAATLAQQSLASVAATKSMLNYLSGGEGSDEHYENLYQQLFFAADAREGAAAFREKRQPAFGWHPSDSTE